MKMADGMNQARAMRIAEIIGDFRNIMSYISNVRADATPEDANGAGYVVVQQCRSEARTILAQPFQALTQANGNTEQEKAELRRIISDAAVRRFRAQKLYMRATAALRWINSRMAVLRGGRAQPQHASALRQIDANLQQELNTITDQRIFQFLRNNDYNDGKWMDEDPTLDTLTRLVAASANRA